MPRSPRLPIATALIASVAALAASGGLQAGGQVYKWKDANGVTHYSENPPPNGQYTSRVFIHAQRKGLEPDKPAASESAQCATARSNVALLQGGGRVQRDSDGDGKPDTDLTPAERSNQLQLAQMVLRTNCAAQAPTTGPVDRPNPPQRVEGAGNER